MEGRRLAGASLFRTHQFEGKSLSGIKSAVLKLLIFLCHMLHCFNIGSKSLLGKSNRDIPTFAEMHWTVYGFYSSMTIYALWTGWVDQNHNN